MDRRSEGHETPANLVAVIVSSQLLACVCFLFLRFSPLQQPPFSTPRLDEGRDPVGEEKIHILFTYCQQRERLQAIPYYVDGHQMSKATPLLWKTLCL